MLSDLRSAQEKPGGSVRGIGLDEIIQDFDCFVIVAGLEKRVRQVMAYHFFVRSRFHEPFKNRDGFLIFAQLGIEIAQ